LIDAVDPLGRRVTCDKKAWDHVCKKHPEFDDPEMPSAVADTIQKPKFITDGKDPGKAQAYYGPAPFPFRATEMIKVAVKLGRASRGYLMSTYIVTGAPPEEGVLWPKVTS
jgi:hypothetical protein